MRKRICIVVHNFSDYGGVGVVASNLANEFADDDNKDVFLLSLIKDGRPLAYELSEKVKYHGILHGEMRLRNQLKALFLPVTRYLKNHQIDVAIIMGHWPAFLISPVKPLVNTKFVFCDHGALLNQWEDKKNTFMRLIASKVSNHTVVLTKRTREDYIKKFFIGKDKIDYIYNWIEERSDDSVDYDSKSKRIITAGRFGYEKGFDQLVEIMRPVIQLHDEWHLDIYGDGEMMHIVQQKIKEYRLENNVHIMGEVRTVRNLFKNYAFYVLPSFREGLPIVLLEAKCNLLPIVSFDVMTGPAEIIRDGIDGMLIEAGNNGKFSEAINYLIESEDTRKTMSNNAKGNLEEFKKNTIMKQWENLVDNL